MQSPNNFDEYALKHELSKLNYEFVNTTKTNPNIIEVEAKKLHAVKIGKNDALYIPVPVSLIVTFDKEYHIKDIKEKFASTDVLKDAEKYVKTLFENQQIEGLNNQSQQTSTHKIEINDKGQRVIKRSGYRSF